MVQFDKLSRHPSILPYKLAIGGYIGLSQPTKDLSTESEEPPAFGVVYSIVNCITWPESTIHGTIAGGIVLPDTAVQVVGHDFIIRVIGSRPGPRANGCIRHICELSTQANASEQTFAFIDASSTSFYPRVFGKIICIGLWRYPDFEILYPILARADRTWGKWSVGP